MPRSPVERRFEEVLPEVGRDALGFLREMLRIPTENPPGLNYGRFASYASRFLESLGYRVEVVEVTDERYYQHIPGAKGPRPNIIATLGEADRKVVFNGHYDVVPAGEGWTHAPYGADVVGGRLYGRGASDMKSGIAAQIFAVELLRRVLGDTERLRRVAHHIVADEETVGNTNAGTGYLAEHGYLSPGKVECVVFTEPFGPENICVGHRGALWGRVEVFGAKSHGGFPLEGADAVKAAAECVCELYRRVGAKAGKTASKHPIVPKSARKPTILVGVLHGGTWANTVADKAEFWYVRRLIPEETLEEARGEVEGCLRSAQRKNRGVHFTNTEFYATPSVFTHKNSPTLRAFEEAVKTTLKRRARQVVSPGTFDIRFALDRGVDAVGYGPGRLELSHTTDEWVSIKQLYASIKVMANALTRILKIDV